jgi:hypothetical protein
VHPTLAGAVTLAHAMIVVPAGGAPGEPPFGCVQQGATIMEQAIIVWFSVGTAVIGGLIILLAGLLLGLGCGLGASQRQRHERAPGAHIRPWDGPSPPEHP